MAQPAKAETKPDAPDRKLQQFTRNGTVIREMRCSDFVTTVEASFQREDLKNPKVYELLADRLRTGSKIAVFHPDWYAEVLIAFCERGVIVSPVELGTWDLPNHAIAAVNGAVPPPGYEIRFDSMKGMYQAFRKETPTRNEAAIGQEYRKYDDCLIALRDNAIFRSK